MSCAPSYNKQIEHDIKSYDHALVIKWNGQVNRWELWRRGKTAFSMVLRIQNEDNSYRPIDRRLLSFLINNDCWKFKSPRAAYDAMLNWDKRAEEKKHLRFENQIDDITKEKAHWISRDRSPGKGDRDRSANSTYRQGYNDINWGRLG